MIIDTRLKPTIVHETSSTPPVATPPRPVAVAGIEPGAAAREIARQSQPGGTQRRASSGAIYAGPTLKTVAELEAVLPEGRAATKKLADIYSALDMNGRGLGGGIAEWLEVGPETSEERMRRLVALYRTVQHEVYVIMSPLEPHEHALSPEAKKEFLALRSDFVAYRRALRTQMGLDV